MTLLNILLAVSFVFGPLALLTNTKLFDTKLSTFLFALLFEPKKSANPYLWLFMAWLGYLVFYASLAFQAWYWLFRT